MSDKTCVSCAHYRVGYFFPERPDGKVEWCDIAPLSKLERCEEFEYFPGSDEEERE